MFDEKPIRWIGSSLQDLIEFPDEARKEAGFQLHLVQHGIDPHDYKPFPQVGAGIREIRIHEGHGIYRVMYVAKFANAIYVLHAFQKKTQKTAKKDIDIATARYKTIPGKF